MTLEALLCKNRNHGTPVTLFSTRLDDICGSVGLVLWGRAKPVRLMYPIFIIIVKDDDDAFISLIFWLVLMFVVR